MRKMISSESMTASPWITHNPEDLDDYWDWEDVSKDRIVSVFDKKVVK